MYKHDSNLTTYFNVFQSKKRLIVVYSQQNSNCIIMEVKPRTEKFSYASGVEKNVVNYGEGGISPSDLYHMKLLFPSCLLLV